ncbi:DDE-type integrase/transposase/recombinase, partial [Candidatus Aerophobetes bacterium]|nr:DDE-type integrase/transposase/recombinase [Candidatus Aerophobetes bacterium]
MQRPICPKCGSPVYKNGHDKYGNQQFICKRCRYSFKISHTKHHKLFSFPYPKCPICSKTMEIRKIRRSFVVFRCRHCHTSRRVPLFLPQPVPFSIHPFKFFRFPILIVIQAFILYFKYNLSFRAIANALSIPVSHVTIYHWIIRLSSSLNPLIPINLFKVHADETIILFKARRYYVWFVVDSESHLILAWHVSRYRDVSNVKILLSKLKSSPDILVTDHMPSYSACVDMFFKDIEHLQVGLGGNNPVESRFSLFKMFVKVKRGFKKYRNIPLYVRGFCIVHNLYKLVGGDFNDLMLKLYSFITNT